MDRVLQPELKSPVKSVRDDVLGLIVMAGLVFLCIVMIRGMVWASEKALRWLIDGTVIAMCVCAFVLLPLCISRHTRPWAGVGFYIGSFLFGATLFALSCIVAVQLWGYGGLFLGLVFGGVGVLPVALLAALFHADWPSLAMLAAGIILTFGSRALGLWLAE